MIPTMIVLGLLCGRWWRTAVTIAALGWPTLLVATDVMGVQPGLLAASALAVCNTAAGVLAHRALLHVVRHHRRQRASPAAG